MLEYEYPTALTGNEQEQIQQLWKYVYKLVELLNMNLKEQEQGEDGNT